MMLFTITFTVATLILIIANIVIWSAVLWPTGRLGKFYCDIRNGHTKSGIGWEYKGRNITANQCIHCGTDMS